MAIKFNRIDLPDYVFINETKGSLLPSVSQNTIKIPGRAGEIDFGNEFEAREFEVTFSIIAESPSDLKDKMREFSSYLYYDEPKELVFLDEPEIYYMAKVTEDIEIDELLRVGQGTITFYCSDPFGYSVEKVYDFNPVDETPSKFTNSGNTKTFPKISFEFTQNATNFALLTDKEMMMFGSPFDVETNTQKDTKPIILHDDMSSTSPWIQAQSIENGTIAGEFYSNGWSFQVLDGNFGTGEKWHGPSMTRTLSKQLQDFRVSANVGFQKTHANQIGRVELYLLDANGTRIGKINLQDLDPGLSSPRAVARAGFLAGGEVFMQEFGPQKNYLGDWVQGKMEIERVGNVWTAYFCQINNGVEEKVLTSSWIDTTGQWSQKISQIQINIASYGSYNPIQYMFISELRVFELLSETQTDASFIFKTGDILEIDSEKGNILLNGRVFFEALDPSSKFITLDKGENGITVTPAIVTNGILSFKERWL